MFKLESKRLVLRDYRTEDWERVHIYGSDAEFCQFEPWGPNTIDDSKKFVAAMLETATHAGRFKFELAVVLKESNLLIGGCSIRREVRTSAVGNLGWAINPEFQKRGLATEAGQTLIDFGFKELGLHVICALCDVRNTASYAVMEKLGMKRVGVVPADKLVKGHMRELYRYEIYR